MILWHRLGTLEEMLEFTGRWIIPPDQPIEAALHLTSNVDATSSNESLAGNERQVWWSAALTRRRSFIWFYSSRRDGLTTGEFEYSVQEKSELHASSF